MKLSLLCWLFLSAISFATVNQSHANESRVYFLSAHPTPKSSEVFPAVLHSSELLKGGLNFEKEVLSANTGSDGIMIDFDKRIVVIDIWGNATEKDDYIKSFEIIDMDTPLKSKTISIKYPKSSITKRFLFDLPSKGLYVGIVASRLNKKTQLIDRDFVGVSIETGHKELLNWQNFEHFRVSGKAGVSSLSNDIMPSVFPSEDGRFSIHVGTERIKYNLIIPKKISFPKKDWVSIYVNNDKLVAFASKKKRVKNSINANTTFDIFNKLDKSWSSLKINGGGTGVRGFGHWLSGYVEYKGHGKASIGKEKRKDVKRKTGREIDIYQKMIKVHTSGELFIYNVKTKKKYEIKTGQGDSEVLLVEGDTVIYRVYDELFRATIGKEKIEQPVLIVKDDVVPDIHWAFMGPKHASVD